MGFNSAFKGLNIRGAQTPHHNDRHVQYFVACHTSRVTANQFINRLQIKLSQYLISQVQVFCKYTTRKKICILRAYVARVAHTHDNCITPGWYC